MRYMELMRRINLTDLELAAKLCVGRMTAYRWNRARVVPTLYMRRALARLGGVKPDDVTWERTR